MHIGSSYRAETYVHLKAAQTDLHTMLCILYVYVIHTVMHLRTSGTLQTQSRPREPQALPL